MTTFISLLVPQEYFEAKGMHMDCPENDLSQQDICYKCCAYKCGRRVDCVGFVYSLNPEADAHCILKGEGMCTNTRTLINTMVYSKSKYPVDE